MRCSIIGRGPQASRLRSGAILALGEACHKDRLACLGRVLGEANYSRRHSPRILRNVPSSLTGIIMTLCPIALVAGCQKCPAFKICPLKGVIGDMPPAPEAGAKTRTPAKSRSAAAKKKKQ